MKILTPTNFAVIRQFILREGDRKTYCNMYNQNPHLAVSGFDLYLNPEDGQRNINCDVEGGGFDELVVSDSRAKGLVTVRLRDGKLEYEAEGALEYYFAATMAHISNAP